MALAQFKVRRGTSAEWASANPVLGLGEQGYDEDADRMKIGDGVTPWLARGWSTMSGADVQRAMAAAEAIESAGTPTDAVMAAQIATPSSATRQALNDTFGPAALAASPELSAAIGGVAEPVADVAQARARSFAKAFGAPMTCRVTRSSNQTGVGDKAPTAISFNTEDLDTHSMHEVSSNPTRVYVPPGGSGIWRARGQIAYLGNAGATGDSNGHREASITKNGGAAVANARINALPDVTRATIVQVDTGDIFLRAGDYIELVAYQNRGTGTLSIDVAGTSTWLSLSRVGDRIGPGGNVYVASDWKYKGTLGFAGDQINASQIEMIDDPVHGPGRTVARFPVTNADNQVTYPRVQLGSNARFASGDDAYVFYAVYVPEDIVSLTGPRSLVIGEIFGPPQAGYGPNVFRIRNNAFALEPDRLYGEAPAYAPTGSFLAWSLPIAPRKGKWTYFIHRVKMSADPAVGLHQMWVNLDDGAGWVAQTLKNPATGADVGTTLNLATIRAGINDGGNNAAFLKVAYTDYSIGETELIYGPYRVASTFADAADGLAMP